MLAIPVDSTSWSYWLLEIVLLSPPFNDGHRLLGFASPVLGIGSGQPDGESTAVYLKGQAAALVIVRQAAMGGIFCRIRRQSIFQVGVVSTDGDSAADFVKPYLGQLVLIPVIILNFTSFRIAFVKGLFLPEKVPFKTGRIHRFSNGNAADDAEAVQRFCKRNSAKICGLDRKTAFLTNRRKHGCKTELFLKKIADCLPFSPNIVFLCLPRNFTAASLRSLPSGRSWQSHIPFGRSFSCRM